MSRALQQHTFKCEESDATTHYYVALLLGAGKAPLQNAMRVIGIVNVLCGEDKAEWDKAEWIQGAGEIRGEVSQ